METFEVLLADDDKDLTDVVKRKFASDSRIRLYVAHTSHEANAVIASTFLHLALIDMQLSRGSSNDGLTVFRELRRSRPSCKGLLLTAYPNEYRDSLFALFDPTDPLASGAIDKADHDIQIADVIRAFAARWFSNIRSINTDEVAPLVIAKMPSKTAQTTRNEIDFVLSSLLGQGQGIDQSETDFELQMHTISLQPLEGGRSRSVVTAGRPIDSRGNTGIWCVMKIGPRKEILQEFSRYSAYVRYVVALNHRVELLGTILGDTIGVMCYSFAGRSPDTINSLYHVFSNNLPAERYLDQIFGLSTRELYGRKAAESELGHYFSATYGLDPRKVMTTVKEFLTGLSRRDTGVGFTAPDTKALNDAFTSALFRTPFETCIVHGDMNANNVIVAEESRVIYIDFSHTGVGPRAVDFAALEASLRLATCPADLSLLASIVKEEDDVLRRSWTKKSPNSQSIAYWAQTSEVLARYAQDNFDGLTKKEYAATCLLWGARLFRVTQLNKVERLRILLWMLQCAKVVSAK